MKRIFLLLVISFIFHGVVHSQRKVEVFVSKASDVKVKIEWRNSYGDSIVQLNVQRSWDSAKNYRTIFVPLSPELPQNGYIDETAGFTGMYYRVFYVLAEGSFFFTKGKKVSPGSDLTEEVPQEQKIDTNFLITVHDEDSVIGQFKYYVYKRFRDSIVNHTKDTLFSLTDADVLIHYFNSEINWVPSTDVFTNTDGYVQIHLADALQKNYRLRFLDEKRKPLFSIQHISEVQLLLDKTDFIHAGWFYFELYENDKLKERNKFYIPKDF